jgi:hypothetical protein
MNRLKHETRENRHRPAAGTTIYIVRSIDKNPAGAMILIQQPRDSECAGRPGLRFSSRLRGSTLPGS